jgi:DNA-3-methyladenine glycosylase II
MTPDYWHEAKAALGKRDARLRRIIAAYPDATLRTRGDAFQTLARSIVGQQISVRAAQTVWERFALAAGKAVTPASVLALQEETLRAAGLSRMKAAYLRDLATHFGGGAIRPRRWARMADEAIIEELTEVKGIGRWSAEMFLIFHLMRPDVLPVGDLGLQRAIEKLYFQGERITKDEMAEVGGKWAPWRTVATWYLWRSLDPEPVEY